MAWNKLTHTFVYLNIIYTYVHAYVPIHTNVQTVFNLVEELVPE